MTAAEIAAVLNAIMRLGIAWQEYGALMDRARAEGRAVSPEDVADLGKRARLSLDKLNALLGDQPPAEDPIEPIPEPTPDDEEPA